MVIYPFTTPIILNDIVYSQYGGLGTGSFTSFQLQSSYMVAEMRVTSYIGTPLLPIIVTGTYVYQGKQIIPTDYGYVQNLLNVNVLSKQGWSNCTLQNNEACGYILEDTYGYIDFKQIAFTCGLAYWGFPFSPYIALNYPYQVQIAYQAGLPTGTANLPPILEALTILAQIDLNEKSPGQVQMNETTGDLGIQEWRSLDYFEKRAEHALVKSALGSSARAQYAKSLIDMTLKRARKVLFA